MKSVFFFFLSVILFSINSNAQKSKVHSAYNYYKEPYKQYDKAFEAIEEASKHEQTSTSAKTWYYRGLIHMALHKDENYAALCSNCLITAYESFKKAMELDPKNEWADDITSIRIPYLENLVFSEGVENFNSAKYNEALTAFEFVQKMNPMDTSSMLNAAYSADKAGQSDKAINYYEQLIAMNYTDEVVFISLVNLYRKQNKMNEALVTTRNGRQLFADNMDLMLTEINLLLSSGNNEEASRALDAAIERDPNNPSLYLALGSTYDNLANPKDPDGNELPKPANAGELLLKAEDAYKDGLKVGPDNYEINYNLGALYFNQAAEMANVANSLTSDKEYENARVKFVQKFREAQPCLEIALEKNPRKNDDDNSLYNGTVESLKQLYVRLGEMEKYEKLKNQ